MSVLKWLNILLFLETLLGIHRKYCNQTKKMKYWIISKIFLQIILFSIVFPLKVFYLLLGDVVIDQVNVIYCVFSVSGYINFVSAVVTAICCSRSFMSCYRSISRLSDWFKYDIKLIKSLKKIYWSTIIFTFFITAFIVTRSLDVLNKFQEMNVFLIAFVFGAQIIIRLTVVYQQIMSFFVIMIVVHLSKSLNSLISAVQERQGSCDICSDEQSDIKSEQILGWVELYKDSANCCDKVTLCFGRQYFFSLVLSISNYISMIFQICSNKGFYIAELNKLIFPLFIYAIVTLLPVFAGQLARNQGRKFHRVLARLYNTMMIDSGETELKLTKDFIRLMKKKPIEIMFLSNIPAGMYMLPVILTMAVNYVLVLLQFNHVI